MSNLSQSEIREFINSYTTTDRSKFLFYAKARADTWSEFIKIEPL